MKYVRSMVNHVFRLAALLFVLQFLGNGAALAEDAAATPRLAEEVGPVATPTPTPMEGCVEWSVQIERYGARRGFGSETMTLYSNGAPQCLVDQLNQWWDSCEGKDYQGDCMVARVLGVPYTCLDLCPGNGLTYDWINMADRTQHWFFAMDCSERRKGSSSEVDLDCVSAYVVAASPVALLWDGSREFSEDFTVANFPLDPQKAGEYTTWKASDNAPLLVYDPQHAGKITSATQLFGNWTFGGKRVASLGSGQPGVLGGPWQNGFEAMASLDVDSDGLLSGTELNDLGLWFDKNRDGVSQPGEVRSAREAGVLSLGFTPDRVDKKTGTIYVEQGFERIESGKIMSGVAVDWYGRSAGSAYGLFLHQIMEESQVDSDYLKPLDNDVEQEPKADAPKPGLLNGAWLWKGDNDGQPVSGALVFDQKEGKEEFSGLSLAEIPLKKEYQSAANARSLLLVMPIRGVQGEKNENGAEQFSFSLSSGGGSSTRSQATLSGDGQELRGISEMFLGSAKSAAQRYSWTASRLK